MRLPGFVSSNHGLDINWNRRMVARTRTRQRVRSQGKTYLPGKPDSLVYQSYVETDHETKDVWKKLKRPDGSLPPGFFESNRTFSRPILFTRLSGSNATWRFEGRPCTTGPTVPNFTGYPLPGSSGRNSENQLLAAELIARSHPFAPVFSIPVAIKELSDIVGMFQLAAKGFLSLIGGAYLNYRFGWQAFYNDVRTLLGITKEIEERVKTFNYLLEHGRTRKKLRLKGTNGSTNSSNQFHHSAYGVAIKGTYDTKWTLETWGSVTWGLNGDAPIPLDELSQFNRAVSVIFDLEEIDAPTLWELIPFSWLIDYFINIGDVLHSQHMRYVIQPYDVCIMRHYVHSATTSVTNKPSSITINREGFFSREIKSRDWVFPSFTPQLTFDLLRGDRWKVLLALAAKFSGK